MSTPLRSYIDSLSNEALRDILFVMLRRIEDLEELVDSISEGRE